MDVWPKDVQEEDFNNGFSPETLESLVDPKSGFWETFPRVSPIAFWETETYSFGKTYRTWLRWPWFLPLPMIADHGVQFKRAFSRRELTSGARTYLTWSSWRQTHETSGRPTVVRIPHPWTIYRKNQGLSPKQDATGTLVFISHTMQNAKRTDFDFRDYMESLRKLPEKFHPMTICIQMHDVRKGLHSELEQFGFPIVTAGNASSPLFVDRFYDLIYRHKYATSNVSGSQQFYCEEAGVPYFLFGKENSEQAPGETSLPYYFGKDRDIIEKAVSLFTLDRLGPHPEKSEFISTTLGLDVDHEAIRGTLRARLTKDFLYLFPKLYFLVLANLLMALVSSISKYLRR